MSTDFLPGLFEDEPSAVGTLPPPSLPVAASLLKPEPERPRVDHGEAFRVKVKLFTCSLSRGQRAEVARRPRFHSMPWLRRADAFDPDDQLP